MAQATYQYTWLGVNIDDINSQIDPNAQGAIAQPPIVDNEGGTSPITMSITLTNADPVNPPPSDDLDDAMAAQGWEPQKRPPPT